MSLPHVALIGHKRAGKDTAAAILERSLGYTRASFADPLRGMMAVLDMIVGFEDALPVRYAQALSEYGYERAKDRFPEMRRLMQYLGTEAVKGVLGEQYGLQAVLAAGIQALYGPGACGATVWSAIMQSRLAAGGHLAIPDLRFPDETELIRSHGGIVVRILRREADLASLDDPHPSEHALDGFAADADVRNDGSLAELEDALLGAVPRIAATQDNREKVPR